MKKTPDVVEVTSHHRQSEAPDYLEREAQGLVGSMVKSKTEPGVYGKVTDIEGYAEAAASEKAVTKPYYGLVVEWVQKPKAELKQESILFRPDIQKHYPLVYGNELHEAKAVWQNHEVAKQTTAMRSDLGNTKGKGKGH